MYGIQNMFTTIYFNIVLRRILVRGFVIHKLDTVNKVSIVRDWSSEYHVMSASYMRADETEHDQSLTLNAS